MNLRSPVIYIYIRGVMINKYDGLVRISVLPSQFGMISVQQVEKLNFLLLFFFKWTVVYWTSCSFFKYIQL